MRPPREAGATSPMREKRLAVANLHPALKTWEEYVTEAARDGHTRSGMVLGIRMALLGLRQLGLDEPPQDHSLITVVETDRCLPDAVELVTGCRLGNRTLKHRDFGKMAATFVDVRTERAIRIATKEAADRKARELFPAAEKEDALGRAYRVLTDEELFKSQWVLARFHPEDLPGAQPARAICIACGEGVSFHREVVCSGRVFCRACAGERYFEPC